MRRRSFPARLDSVEVEHGEVWDMTVLERPGTRQPPCHDTLLRTMFDRHGRVLERYVTKLLGGDHHAAADIVQETAVRAWQHVDGLDVGGPEFRPWLFKVARRLVVDRHRRRTSRPAEVGGAVPDRPARAADPADRIHTRMVVSDLLASLSHPHREVITELYLRESSIAETAQRLGVSPGTVKSRAFYALRMLRAMLGERGLVSPL
jgi:RNA polymerase sigma-70 factor (ECF subfamily)